MDSGVTRLPQTILLRIFYLNNNMEHDPSYKVPAYTSHRAIECLRSVSQVSAAWRAAALSARAAPLWANVIDLSFLISLNNTEWTMQVLARTRGLPLTVKWHPRRSAEYDVVRPLLHQYWPRIRKLELIASAYVPPRNVFASNPQYFEFFVTSAPLLESITCVFPDGKQDVFGFDPSEMILPFGNVAPRLREYNCNVSFSLHTSWLGGLRNLTLDVDSLWERTKRSITSSDLFPILESTRALEKLTLRRKLVWTSVAPSSSSAGQHMVSLCNLRHIEITGNQQLEVVWKVLDLIVPSIDGCNVVLLAGHYGVKAPEPSGTVLLNYLMSAIYKNNPASLAISAIRYRFHVYDHLHSISHRSSSLSTEIPFDIDIQYSSPEGPSTALAAVPVALLQQIYPADYSGITNLDLDLSDAIFDPRDISFVRFIQSFSSVQILRASSETINILSAVPTRQPILPRLHTLVMTNIHVEDGSIRRFLSHQRTCRRPVKIFEFTVHSVASGDDLARATDFTFLNQFVGLTVKWTYGASQGEFVCGGKKTKKESKVLLLNDNYRFSRWDEYKARMDEFEATTDVDSVDDELGSESSS